ncbi:MAG: 23S rRNA (guanosine(2251)-2'-O)-methyltransferase RlmB [bacterium]
MKEELIYGRNSVLEALVAERRSIRELVVSDSAHGQKVEEIKKRAARKGINLRYRTRKEMDTLCQTPLHQGVAAFVTGVSSGEERTFEVEDILDNAQKRNELPFLLILDRIEDPRNLGSLIRTGEAAGIHGMIISKHGSSGLTPAVAKASSGAIEYVPIVQVSNLAMLCENLKKMGIWLFGADGGGEPYSAEADFTLPLAIVLGSEGKGLKSILKKKCDFLISIPMRGHISSLNVAVAGAILMYEVVKQRKW